MKRLKSGLVVPSREGNTHEFDIRYKKKREKEKKSRKDRRARRHK